MKTATTVRGRKINRFRTLFLALIAAIAFTATASAITITVEVGRQSRDCTGFGICSITIEAGTAGNTAIADAVLNGNELTLSFEQQFGQPGELLPIDAPIVLDPQTSRALGAGQVVILPGMYTVSYGDNPNGRVTVQVQRIGIVIEVEVGRKSRDCTGFGICSITIETSLLSRPVPTVGTMHGDSLKLRFTEPTQEREDVLVIDEDIVLDAATSRALGIEPSVVKAGSYPVDYSNNPNGTVTLPTQRLGVTIHVEAGRRSKGCTGFGICSITIEIDLLARPVLTTGTVNENALTLYFLEPMQEREDVIVIDEDIVIDSATAQALGIEPSVVRAGSYPVDYSNNPNGVVTLPLHRISVEIHVELGRKSRGCRGFGICYITIETSLLSNPVPTDATVDGNVLTIDFKVSPPDRQEHIVIDEDILLDSATAQALGIEPRYIKAGAYRVDYSSNPNGTVHLTLGTESTVPAGLTIHVKIGLRSMGCRGFGICDIWIDASAVEATTPAFGKLNGNTLSLEFQSQMNEQGSQLVIEEPVELDAETSLALGARRVVLMPGSYPVDYSSNPNGSVDVKVQRIGVTIGVDIGRPSKNCTGLGICKVWIEFDLRQGTTQTVASLQDSTLTLLFPTDLPELGDAFEVEEDVVLDARVARMLGAKGLTIKKGSYVIRRDAEGRPYVELPVARIGITITIYVGHDSDCHGFGICRITIETHFSARTIQAIATTNNGTLELDFLNEAPDSDDALYLEHGLTLDAATAAALGFSEILPGEYAMDYSTNPNGVVTLRTDNVSSSVRPEEMNAADKAQAFPNPTNGTTTLRFDVRHAGPVVVTLADARGDVVAQLVDESMEAGEQSVSFDASTLADGVYFYTIQTATGVESGTMMVAE